MTNFSFLKDDWSALYKKLLKAEERAITEPESTAFQIRLALEECLYHIFDLEYIEMPYNKDVFSLLKQEELINLIPADLMGRLHIVRKTGNSAAHYGKKVYSEDAVMALRHFYDFTKWFATNYNEAEPDLPGSFNMAFIPKLGEKERKLKEIKAENERELQELKDKLEALHKEKEKVREQAEANEQAKATYEQELKNARAQILEQKESREQPHSREYTEAETRKHLIDISLKEAGWSLLRNGRELEYPVTHMPVTSDNPKGNGYADYVLWDDDGKPLAVIEAKRTSKSAEVGKHQATLYADSLQKMHGQRPVIFYSNGYNTYLWDDQFYSAPRRVYGFYTKSELQWLIQKRSTRKDIRKAQVNTDIAGRPYQMEAIQRVAENFSVDSSKSFRGAQRSALLVMATGSGKTRTAAALVDVLLKHNWVKRVLFLADRNALVRQAKGSFGDNLPEVSSIDLTQEKEAETTRLVFSTYPTMMNLIDNMQSSDGRFYGVGHFDLIIIDEAHRSVYNRYKAIFEYFDALVVGLTATPKDSIDHNTFELFGCSSGDPTFDFELSEAVPLYLCDYKNVGITTKFMREGIKYKELSREQQKKYEDTFLDNSTGLFPKEIGSSALNKWLFNKDTVNKVLDALMENGLKIQGGDELGRTIIFAANQSHAEFIVECFTERYPEKPSGYIATIHNQVSHNQSLIDKFCDHHKENLPQIAVSVDMMDTGIDAPRTLNLIFFKVVRSYAKFWQMIGRGTRLCPDVFGPGQKKEHFLIFDVCGNFEFFEENKKGQENKSYKSLSAQIFESRLLLSRLLLETSEDDVLELSSKLRDMLHSSIIHLDKERFQVRMSLEYVDKFSERKKWENINEEDVHEIENHLSSLPVPETVNEIARRFDLMMLKYQIGILMMNQNTAQYEEKFQNIADQLSKKYSIPQVARSKVLIESMKDPEFYKALKQKQLEEIRQEIRELVQYLESETQEKIYTNIEDSAIKTDWDSAEVEQVSNYLYRSRVESYIRKNKNHITIFKIKQNKPISTVELEELERILFDGEERGTRENYEDYGDHQPLGTFIRSIIGLDELAAQEAFADLLSSTNPRADQITFIQNIIKSLTVNGILDKRQLFEPPFTNQNDQGLLGIFDDAQATKIISIIDEINRNALVG